MKILLISDIHANFPALEAVWQKESDSDIVLCAGDLVDWGYYPKEVLDWCRQHQIITVAGNHDLDICRYYRGMESGQQPPIGTFTEQNLAQLSPDDIRFLEGLPTQRVFQAEAYTFFISHFFQDEETNRHALLDRWLRFETKSAFEEVWPQDIQASNRVILTGHSHQCYLFQVQAGSYFLNPGSISYRVYSDSRLKGADYAILQDGEFRLRHVDYDQRVFSTLHQSFNLNAQVSQAAKTYLCPEDDI